MHCGMCGGSVWQLLGRLASLVWVRCRACGFDHYTESEGMDDDNDQ